MCRKAIRVFMNEEEIEKILLPPILKEFLKADHEWHDVLIYGDIRGC